MLEGSEDGPVSRPELVEISGGVARADQSRSDDVRSDAAISDAVAAVAKHRPAVFHCRHFSDRRQTSVTFAERSSPSKLGAGIDSRKQLCELSPYRRSLSG